MSKLPDVRDLVEASLKYDDIGLITYAFESVFIRHVLYLTYTTHMI